jgi:hypothetical protein
MRKILYAIITCFLVVGGLGLSVIGNVSGAPQITSTTKSIKTEVGTFSVNLVEIPRDSKRIEFVTSVAHEGQIGFSEPLSALAQKENGIAAINGTFFDAYTNQEDQRYPSGTIMVNEEFLHTMTHGSTVSFMRDGNIDIERLEIRINGFINGEYQWYAWRMNHPSQSADAIILFTPEYANGFVTEDGTKIVVKEGVVTSITTSDVSIPDEGFVVLFGTADYPTELTQRFSVGDIVHYEFKATSPDQNEPYQLDKIVQMVGAGPKLLSAGEIDVNFEKDKMIGVKHTTVKASRSFVGYNDDVIILGTTTNAVITN